MVLRWTALLLPLATCVPCIVVVDSFQPCFRARNFVTARQQSSAPSDVEVEEEFARFADSLLQPSTPTKSAAQLLDRKVSDENEALKRELIKLAASYDRGFGASPAARDQAHALIAGLERGNTATAVADTILNPQSRLTTAAPTLVGKYRMIWTTALDVLLLQASPLFIAGAIYQVFEAETRVVTNIIDFIPRAQSLLPTSLIPSSLIRASVRTRACQPTPSAGGGAAAVNENANRVGLVFEAVSVTPIQILGVDARMLPPLAFDLPKLPESTASPGYFDVTYLDHELLVIRQNAPGGLFALLRVDSIDP